MSSFNQFFSRMPFPSSIRFVRSDVTRFIDRLLEHSALVYFKAFASHLSIRIERILITFVVLHDSNTVETNQRKQYGGMFLQFLRCFICYKSITRAHLLPRLHDLPLQSATSNVRVCILYREHRLLVLEIDKQLVRDTYINLVPQTRFCLIGLQSLAKLFQHEHLEYLINEILLL